MCSVQSDDESYGIEDLFLVNENVHNLCANIQSVNGNVQKYSALVCHVQYVKRVMLFCVSLLVMFAYHHITWNKKKEVRE